MAAQLAGHEVDAAARDLAREVFVASITEVWFTLRRCSMGEQMCEALGYAYVRQTQKVRGEQSVGRVSVGLALGLVSNPYPNPNPNPN